jgi:NAD(P)H-flavin reductase
VAGTALRRRLTWQVAKVITVRVWPYLNDELRAGMTLRTLGDVIYHAELDQPVAGVEVIHTLTRHQPPCWAGYARRVDAALLGEVAWPASAMPLAYVCGPTRFVEAVLQPWCSPATRHSG